MDGDSGSCGCGSDLLADGFATSCGDGLAGMAGRKSPWPRSLYEISTWPEQFLARLNTAGAAGLLKNIEEKALKANQRRYLVIFQACISNVADQGASVAANAMVKYAF